MMTTTPANEIVTGDTLVDQTFVSTAVTGHELAAGSEISLSFTGAALSANAGCNTMNGSYVLEGAQLVVAGLSSTMMGCEPALMEQDTWLSTFLESSPGITATGTGIALAGGGVTIELAPDASGGPSATGGARLVGPTWQVHSFVDGDALMSVAADGAPTFTFADDGTVAIFTGCNRGSTTYVASDDGTITFAPLAMTMMACEDPGAQALEPAIVALTSAPATYELDGDDLVLRGGMQSMVASPS
jgi:heat shock protein HslJ